MSLILQMLVGGIQRPLISESRQANLQNEQTFFHIEIL
jgi:hypothetical protein